MALRCGIKRQRPAVAAIAEIPVASREAVQTAVMPVRLLDIPKATPSGIEIGGASFMQVRTLGRIASTRTTAQGVSFFCTELFTPETLGYLNVMGGTEEFTVERLDEQGCFPTSPTVPTPKVLALWKQPGLSSALQPGSVVELYGSTRVYNDKTPPSLQLAEHPRDRKTASSWRYFDHLRRIATVYWTEGFADFAAGGSPDGWELTARGSPYDFSGGTGGRRT